MTSPSAPPAPSPGLFATDRLLFEASPDCVKIIDLEGRLTLMNHNGRCAMEVDDFAALCGQAWSSMWPEATRGQIDEAIGAAMRGEVSRFTAFCPTVKGTPRWWDVTVTPMTDPGGAIVAMLSVSRDITALEFAREEQRETAERLRFVLETAQLGEWELDLTTGEARTSRLHDGCFGLKQPVTGWSFERFIGYVHPDDRVRVENSLADATQAGASWEFECRVIWDDSSEHWIQVHGRFLGDAGEAPTRLLGSIENVTARKQAEFERLAITRSAVESAEAAERQRRRLDTLLQAAPVGIAYVDGDGHLMTTNAAMRVIWGEQPFATTIADFANRVGWWADGSERHGQPLGPGDWPVAHALRGEHVLGAVIEIQPFDDRAGRRTLLVHGAPLRDAAGAVAGGMVVQQDITDQVRAESELRASERRFRTITDAMPQMVWSARADGYTDFFNHQWYAFTGAPEGSLRGFDWVAQLHPEDRAASEAAFRHSCATGELFEIEYRLQHCDGGHRWVLARGLPVRDDAGDIVRWMGTSTDIHDHRMVVDALGQREEALREAGRRKDEFLAMLAHELRNPLAPISTAAELLRLSSGDADRVQRTSEIISRQVRHMTNLVDDLLDVSRVTRGLIQIDEEAFDIRSAAQSAIEQVRPLLDARRHELAIRIGGEPAWARGDRTRITQVIANLLNNAAKYTAPEGSIALDVSLDGDNVRVSVTDDGQGIDPVLLPQVFDLFTQGERAVDRAQGGLGIGLALVRSLVELHGGEVSAASDGNGRGSRFDVRLPRAPMPATVARVDDVQSRRPGPQLHVVVVDDNEDAAHTLAVLLEACGHRVTMLHDAHATLRLDPAVCVDAFVLDIGLPDLSGHELARRLRAHSGFADARLYALTGYGQSDDRAASRAAGFDRHFVKPVEPAALLAALHDDAHRPERAVDLA